MIRLVAPFLVLFSLCGAAGAAPAVSEQEILAEGIFSRVAALDSERIGEIAALYRRAADECPDTERAREALWNLSSLSIERTPPDWKAAAEALETFLKRYPAAPDATSVVERLLFVYEESRRYADAVPLYERLLRTPEDIPADDVPAVRFRYARALEGAGRKDEARKLYERICAEAPGTDAAGMARDRLDAAGKNP